MMEKGYWLSRKRASVQAAQDAVSAEARLIHYDLAGRYSLKALSAQPQAIDLAEAPPPPVCAGEGNGAKECSDA
jgi:hypothetical protein